MGETKQQTKVSWLFKICTICTCAAKVNSIVFTSRNNGNKPISKAKKIKRKESQEKSENETLAYMMQL